MLEDLEKLERKITQVVDEISSLREEKRNLLTRIRALEGEREKYRLEANKVGKLERELNALLERNIKLQGQVAELSEVKKELDDWQEHKSEIQVRIGTLIEKITSIEAEVVTAERATEPARVVKAGEEEERIEATLPLEGDEAGEEEERVEATLSLEGDEADTEEERRGIEVEPQVQEEAERSEEEGKEENEEKAEGENEGDSPTLEFPSEYFRSIDS